MSHYAPAFDANHRAAHPRRPPRPRSVLYPPALTAVRRLCDALREGLAATREYESLRSRGFSHDAALKRAIAIGDMNMEREGAPPVYFAGKV